MRLSKAPLKDIDKYPVAVLGFGRAGRAVTEHLIALGNPPTVYAQAPVPEEVQATYRPHGVIFAGDFPTVFPESFLVRSPGLRPDHPAIRAALARGSILTGEADLFLALTSATVIGVTGSDGKTTTANLIAALLRAAGKRVLLGGNNGVPLLPQLSSLGPADYAVVELSSFQLMTAPAPDVAVLTNLSPNHLDWHADMQEYAAAKCHILHGARALVTNADCKQTREIGERAPLPVRFFSVEDAPSPKGAALFATVHGDMLRVQEGNDTRELAVFRDFPLPGRHNRANLAAAVLACAELVSDAQILRTAREFRGVKHRLQKIATVRGVTYINSSIDTSPTRTVAALSALDAPLVVIAGGRGKGVPFTPMTDALSTRARAVFLYGEAAGEIGALLEGRVPVFYHDRFSAAFDAAARFARAGECVLLSPGCTAFGEFRDFEERGECFCRLVEALAKERIEHIGTSRTDPCNGRANERYGL